jgi:uncharacterized membrane protein
MLGLESIDVNYGLQTFDSSIRCRDGDLRIAWHLCDTSAARCEDDRFLSLPVWRNCDGYLLSLFGAFPSDSEAGFLSGARHRISDAWQLGILFRRYFTNRGIRRDNRAPGATLHRIGSRRVFIPRTTRPHEGTFVPGRAFRVNPCHRRQMEYDRYWLPFGSRIYGAGSDFLCGVVLVGKGLQSVKPEIVTFVQCAVGVLTLPIIDPSILHTSIELRQWGWLFGLGVIHTSLVYALIYHALPKLKSSAIAILAFIYPASGIFFDFVVNGKLLSPVQFLGFVIIVLSSVGITQGWELPRFSAARVKLWSSATGTHEDGGVPLPNSIFCEKAWRRKERNIGRIQNGEVNHRADI